MANEETKVIEEQTSNETPLSEGERDKFKRLYRIIKKYNKLLVT